MKFKKIGIPLLASLMILSICQSSFAEEIEQDNTSRVISVDGESVIPYSGIGLYGAGVWDYIGRYNFKHVIRIQSGGGDLKVCLPGTDEIVEFGLEKAPIGKSVSAKTSGVEFNNCAVWRDIGGSGAYDIGNVSHYGTSLIVDVYD